MGKDSCGYKRKECFVNDCDCEEYERFVDSDNINNCLFCSCLLIKYRWVDFSSNDL